MDVACCGAQVISAKAGTFGMELKKLSIYVCYLFFLFISIHSICCLIVDFSVSDDAHSCFGDHSLRKQVDSKLEVSLPAVVADILDRNNFLSRIEVVNFPVVSL